MCVWLSSWPRSPDITSLASEDLIASVLKEDLVHLQFFPGTLLLKGRPMCFQFCQQFSSGISAFRASTKWFVHPFRHSAAYKDWCDMTTYMGYDCVTLYLMLSMLHISQVVRLKIDSHKHTTIHTHPNIHTTSQCQVYLTVEKTNSLP